MSTLIKTEGTVNLSITELDNLRNKISTLTAEKEELLKHVKEVRINLVVEESYNDFVKIPTWDSRGFGSAYRTELHQGRRILQNSEQYVNLQEVIAELKLKEESKVIEKLGSLDRQIIFLKEQIEKLKTKHQKEIVEINNKHKEDVDSLLNQSKDKINDLNKEINSLKGIVADKTKDEIISSLQQEIELLKLQGGFWGFLFKTKKKKK